MLSQPLKYQPQKNSYETHLICKSVFAHTPLSLGRTSSEFCGHIMSFNHGKVRLPQQLSALIDWKWKDNNHMSLKSNFSLTGMVNQVWNWVKKKIQKNETTGLGVQWGSKDHIGNLGLINWLVLFLFII